MKKTEKVEVKYVTLSTALIIGLVGLIVGFLAGNIYSVYKSGPGASGSINMPNSVQNTSLQQSGQIFALEREAEKNPKNQAVWLNLGNLYFDTNKYQDAIRAYNKYIELNPNDANVWTDLGVMHRRTKNASEAISSFDKAIELNPKHEQARFNKGIVLFYDLGNREAGKQIWIELSQINPNFQTTSGQTIKEFLETL